MEFYGVFGGGCLASAFGIFLDWGCFWMGDMDGAVGVLVRGK